MKLVHQVAEVRSIRIVLTMSFNNGLLQKITI